MGNKNLHKAKKNKNDDFYTKISDIEHELKYYTSHFEDKVVLCNCDDPRISNFFNYFSYNFERLKLKKLIATCYKSTILEMFSESKSERAIYLEYEGAKKNNRIPNIEDIGTKFLKGDGDFRNSECIDLLKQADIVVTNPPFSLFREYISQLIKYEKKFLVIGSINAVFYTEIFGLIRENKIWIGCTSPKEFLLPGGGSKGFGNIYWFTNLHHKKRNEELILVKKYYGNEEDYPKYDDCDAIEVSKVVNIPKDYYGDMGVPVSFIDKYNPEQFEILGSNDKPLINGVEKYLRFLIRRKK